jgi:hypothetical protein
MPRLEIEALVTATGTLDQAEELIDRVRFPR